MARRLPSIVNQPKDYASIDAAPEERERGIINQDWRSTLSTKLKNVTTLTSTPRTRGLRRNMITGAAQMDGAILVVASTDGPMPQTREHILFSRQVGVKQSYRLHEQS